MHARPGNIIDDWSRDTAQGQPAEVKDEDSSAAVARLGISGADD